MKGNKGFIFIVIFLFIGLAFAPSINASFDIATNEIISLNDGNHPPIYIDGNGDFTPENGVTGGNGTEDDPYIIENWVIVGDGSDGDGIFIGNTDVFFVIRNCTVSGFTGRYFRGILLSHVENGKIESSITYGNYVGIGVANNSAYIEIVNCSCGNYSVDWAKGIRCDNSAYISIMSSECHDTDHGILLNETSYIVIENSSFYNNYWEGIWAIGWHKHSVLNHTIKDCKVYNNDHMGIEIEAWGGGGLKRRHSSYVHIANCDIYDNGLPKPGYDKGFEGIVIWGLHDNTIENCSVYNNWAGILIVDSTNNIIRNCSIFNHSHNTGILAPGVQIWKNGFTLGMNMRKSHNEITNCDIYNNDEGIYLARSKTIVQKNNIFNNSWDGIIIEQFDRSHINYNNIYGNGFHELSDGAVVTIFTFADLRHNWWGSSDGPKTGRGNDLYRPFSIAFFRPWEREPIPDAGIN